MSSQKLPEEAVKISYLVPYLVENLGLSREELDFETNFKLKLGRQVGQPPIRGGRLDILVRRGGANLMVVETKAEGETLTDDDRDQVVSYARLLPQIAPLSLLTNGSDFRIFDTISKQEIPLDEIDTQKHFQVVVPPDLLARRAEALRLFLGYSPENLAVFCRAQVSSGMSELRGSAVERSRKYIPELFVPRGDLWNQVEAFLSSPLPLFIVLGDSGLGKTCSLCSTTESLLNDGVTALFYRGSILSHLPLLQQIAEDFAWDFTDEEGPRKLINRLRLILGERPLVIVIDAIDEWTSPARMQELGLTVRRLSGTGIKIILSCKVRVWGDFSKAGGEPTGIDSFIFGGKPYHLPPMNKDEFHEAIRLYRTFYGVSGAFEDTALDAARRSPFLLRILFEVASKHGEEHLTFSSLQFFHSYYEQLIARLREPIIGDTVLRDVARLMFEQNTDRVRLYDVARALGLEKVRALIGELAHYQILESAHFDGNDYLFFYFSLLRDYLIAFRVNEWHRLADRELLDSFSTLTDSAVHIESLAFFYRYAEEEQKRIVDASVFERANAFAELYDEILRTHFLNLRDQFSPYTKGEIGFAGQLILDRGEIGHYGFRERGSHDEHVLLLPYPRFKWDSNLLQFYGVREPHFNSAFRTSDLRSYVLNDEVFSQLRRILDQGLLDETCCLELAAEAVAVEVARDRRLFSDTHHETSAGPIFPLSVSRVRYWLRYELLYYHFQRVREEEKLRSGEIKVTRHRSGSITYSWNPALEDSAWIAGEVEANVNSSEEEVRRLVKGSTHLDLKRLDARLSRSLDALDRAGIQIIDGHPFSNAVDLWKKWGRPSSLSLKDTDEFMERLFAYIILLARRIVEHNFPTIAQQFKTLFNPFIGIIAIGLEREDVWQGATIYLCEPDPSQTDVIFLARNEHEVKKRIVREPDHRFEVCCDGVWRPLLFPGGACQRTYFFSALLHPRHDYLGLRSNSRSFGPVYPVMRAIVYDWIRGELASALDALCKLYGVRRRERDWTFFPQSKN